MFSITPVERIGDYYFKREDKYRPYGFSPVNGSKLRQCELLVDKNTDKAKNGIITGTSVLSPQAAIVATVAKAYNLPCTIMYGGTTMEALSQKRYSSLCMDLGANVEVVSKSGFTSVLTSKAEAKAKANGLLHVRYGMDLMGNMDVFLGSVAEQVDNIPYELDNLIVTVGSAITLIGILVGIARYGKVVHNIYGIGCAPNREEKIRHYAETIEYETGLVLPMENLHYVDAFNTLQGYRYENVEHESYYGIDFHPRYEAKTFKWLKNSGLTGETLMWITGRDF